MPDYDMSANVSRLHQAKLVNPSNLTADDIALIDKFSLSEIDMMIQIARKAYGNDAEIVKLVQTESGKLRICFPL